MVAATGGSFASACAQAAICASIGVTPRTMYTVFRAAAACPFKQGLAGGSPASADVLDVHVGCA